MEDSRSGCDYFALPMKTTASLAFGRLLMFTAIPIPLRVWPPGRATARRIGVALLTLSLDSAEVTGSFQDVPPTV